MTRRVFLSAGLASMALASVVLAGRFTGHVMWVKVLSEGAPMAFTTAVSFLALGAGMVCLAFQRIFLGRFFAAIPIALGAGTLAVFALAYPMGWKSFVYDPVRPIVAAGAGMDGRMAPNTCLCFILLGTTLWLTGGKLWRPRTFATLAGVVWGISLIALVSYATGLRISAAWWRYISLALHTAAGMLAISSALLFWVVRRASPAERVVVRTFPLFALAGLTVVFLVVIVAATNDERRSSSGEVRRALEIKAGLERFIGATARADAACRNFILLGEAYYLEPIKMHRTAVLRALDDIGRVDENDRETASAVASLRALALQNFAIKDAQVLARQQRGIDAASALVRAEPAELLQSMRTTADALLAEEDRQLLASETVLAQRENRMQWALLVCAAVAAAMISVAFGLLAKAQRRLHDTNLALEIQVTALQTIADSLPVLIGYIDADFRYRFTNQTYQHWLGKDPRALIGQEIWAALGDNAREALQPILEKVFRGERVAYERSVATPSGERFIRSEYIPDLGAEGEVRGFYVLGTDLTERHVFEERMAKARDEALAASRLKSDFMARVSHEIRTPLNGILGMSKHLLDNTWAKDQREVIQVLDDSAEILLGIINDVLDFSKLEAGKVLVEEVKFNPRDLVEGAMAALQPVAKKKGLELGLSVAAEVPAALRGDARRLRQVLMNFAANALKFTDQGSVVFRVEQLNLAADVARLRFSVRDTGPGISAESQGRLFQPFEQLEVAPEKRQGGTGLGLAICRELVAVMGGKIGVDSQTGQGAEFWFIVDLPVAEETGSTAPFTNASNRRALIVDDDPADRYLTAVTLRKIGYEVSEATSAEEALAMLADKTLKWGVILVDQKMPGASGVEFGQTVRDDAALADIPLILMSGAAVTDAHVLGRMGFRGFLSKPVTGPQIQRILGRFDQPAVRMLSGIPDVGTAHPGPQGPALRILVADDSDANRYVCKAMLSRLGYSLEFAKNGREALEKLADARFDAVLMDCQMPVMSGYEATERVRRGLVPGVPPDLPIIAVTAFALAGDAERCRAAGMSDYISKPIRVDAVVAALHRAGLPVSADSIPPAGKTESVAVLDERHVTEMKALPGQKGGTVWDELIVAFRSNFAERLSEMEQMWGQHDHEGLANLAHKLAGSCAGIGAGEMKVIALKLQRAAEAGDAETVARSLVALHSARERIELALNRDLG